MTHFLPLEHTLSPTASQQQEEMGLQYRASSSLCQLSDHICADLQTHRQGESGRQLRENCSPWKQQKDEMRLQQFLLKMRKKSSLRPINDNYKVVRSVYKQQGEFTDEIFKPRYPKHNTNQSELKKFPSVFIRLMAAKQSKQTKQNSQTEMLTILKKRNDYTHSQIKKAVLLQREDNYSIQVRKSQAGEQEFTKGNYGIKNGEGVITTHSTYQQRVIKQGLKVKNIYPNKSRSIKRGNQNKQNSMLPKKYHQQYQSRNPLTKLLYQKYVNTISMTHPVKEGRYK